MGPRPARTRSLTEPASDPAVELCESSDDGERKDVPCHASVHNKFQERVRLPNTDKHGAKVVHEGCDIHVLPGAFTKIFRLAVDDVRGLLHHALSLGQGSHLDLFWKALRLELRHRGLVLRQGAPPAHVQQRNEFMIRLLCWSGRNVIKKQVLLTLLPNGSREGFEILIYVIDTRVVNAKELLMCSGNGFFDSTGRI